MTQHLSAQNLISTKHYDATFTQEKPDVTKHYDTTFIHTKPDETI